MSRRNAVENYIAFYAKKYDDAMRLGRPVNSCSYCGRTEQTSSHKTCDGCGVKKPRVYGMFMGVEVTDPTHFREMLSALGPMGVFR